MLKKVLVLILLLTAGVVFSQSTPPPPSPPPPGFPVNGALYLLLALGAGYGIGKKRK